MSTLVAERPLSEAIQLAQDGGRTVVFEGGFSFGVVPAEDVDYIEKLEDELDYITAMEILKKGGPYRSFDEVVAELDKKHGL